MALQDLIKKLEEPQKGKKNVDSSGRVIPRMDDETKKLLDFQNKLQKHFDVDIKGVPQSKDDLVNKVISAINEKKKQDSFWYKAKNILSKIDFPETTTRESILGMDREDIYNQAMENRTRIPEEKAFDSMSPGFGEKSINPELEVNIGTDARKAKRNILNITEPTRPRSAWNNEMRNRQEQPLTVEQLTPEQQELYNKMLRKLESGEPLEPYFGPEELGIEKTLADKIKSGQELTIDEIREAREKGIIESPETTGRTITGSIKAGFGDVLSTAGGAAQWLGEKTGLNFLEDAGKEMQERGERTAAIWGTEYDKDFSWKSFFDPKFYITTVARSAPFMASLIPGMYAGYAGTSAAAAARGFGAFGRHVLGSLGAGLLSRPLESALEAGATYIEAQKRGMSKEEAEKAADQVFDKNLNLAGMDAAELALAFAPGGKIGDKFSKLSKIAKGGGKLGEIARAGIKLGGSAAMEAGEEGYQEYIQRSALGEDFSLKDPEVQQAMAIGAIYGGGMGGIGAAYDYIKGKTIKDMSPKQRAEFDKKVAEKKAEGKPIEQAAQEALDEFAETEEGKRHIEKVIEEATRPIEEEKPPEVKVEETTKGKPEKVPEEKPEPVEVKKEEPEKPEMKPETEDKKTLMKNKLRVKKSRTKNGKEVWEVSGYTKEHKEIFKKLGGKWYGPKKVWSFYGEDPTAKIAQVLRGESEESETKLETKQEPKTEAVEQVKPKETGREGYLNKLRKEVKALDDETLNSRLELYKKYNYNEEENIVRQEIDRRKKEGRNLTYKINKKFIVVTIDGDIYKFPYSNEGVGLPNGLSKADVEDFLGIDVGSENNFDDFIETLREAGYEEVAKNKVKQESETKTEEQQQESKNQKEQPETENKKPASTNKQEEKSGAEKLYKEVIETIESLSESATPKYTKKEAESVKNREDILGEMLKELKNQKEEALKAGKSKNELTSKEKGGKEVAGERELQSGPTRADGEGTLEEVQAENVQGTGEERRPGESTKGSRSEDGERTKQNVRGPEEEISSTERRERTRKSSPSEEPGTNGMGSTEGRVDTSTERRRPAETGNKPGRVGHSLINYVITENELGKGGAKTKFKDNIEAIKTLKQIEEEERLATLEEQKKLVKYVGWGGIPQAFDEKNKKWSNEYQELKELLTKEEYESARATVNNAHYTSEKVIRAMYEGVKHLGFDGGKVLEPGMGIGHFFGLMPQEMAANSQFIGVEIDSISGRIAKQLYQKADINIKGYEETKIAENSIDLAISNVPFADVKPYDPKYKKYKFNLHDYFFAKTIDAVHPGGLVMFITSSGTMNKKNSKLRDYLNERADFLGAVRLPSTAFKENALTEVTTDIIVLRKKIPGENFGKSAKWNNVVPSGIKGKDGKELYINEYFAENPDMVLGELTEDKLHPGRIAVKSDGRDLGKAITEALKKLPENVYSKSEPKFMEEEKKKPEKALKVDEVQNFGYFIDKGKVYRKYGDEIIEVKKSSKSDEPLTPSSKRFHRIKGMLEIRDVLKKLISLEMTPGVSDEELSELRKELNIKYDKFYKKYGAISNPYTNASENNGMKGDPDLPLLMSIENYDEKTKKATKGDIFKKRTMRPPEPIDKADTPEEALTISLTESGKIDFKRMSALTGLSEQEIQEKLISQGLIYKNPIGGWETADQYLSGNVREKLRIAKEHAKKDKQFEKNVEALELIQPEDLKPGDIYVKLGSPWIPTEYIEQFVDHLMGEENSVTISHAVEQGLWTVDVNNYYVKHSVEATSKWGTNRVDAITLIEQALNHKRPIVRDTIGTGQDKKTVVNMAETAAAEQKQEEIKAEFERWIWSDTKRTDELVKIYNENYNNIRLRSFDGSHLKFPGMNKAIQLMKHQKDAVWRILQGGNTLLGHVVGAGKTYTMIAAGMEAKRIGIANKPLYVVPNHLLEQFTSDFYKLYPSAKILSMGGTDIPTHRVSRRKAQGETQVQFEERRLINSAKRQTIMEKIRTGDWDAIIVTQEAFTKLPVSPEYENQFIKEQIEEIASVVERLKRAEAEMFPIGKSDSRIIKQLENMKKRLKEKMKKDVARENKDIGTPFEELGIDMLFVDEAHLFKNLQYATKMTNVAGLPNAHSQRAFDMFMKTQWLTRRNNGRGVVFATGTPIANSMAEMFTMQRYMQMDELKARGLHHFDSWAANFGEPVRVPEVDPTGKGFRIKTKFNKFVNLPELLHMFRQFADIQTVETLDLPRPELKNGEREKILAPASEELNQYVDELIARAEAVRAGLVSPTEDNMLKITGDGRKAALDMRLIDPKLPDNPNSKVNICVRKVHEIWHKYKEDRAAQLVFLDLSTPKGKKGGDEEEVQTEENEFNITVYQDIKNKLLKRGIPEHEIAFIHDAKTDAQKKKLFDAVNDGRVRILIGSTEKMGAGMNVQERLVALHHLDAPWRPADVEQREGRILRRGNMYKDKGGVHIFYYATEQSFDARMWDIIASKAKMIEQIMSGKLDTREMQDVGEATMTYEMMVAEASGNPLIKEKFEVDQEVQRLQQLLKAYNNQKHDMQKEILLLKNSIEKHKELIEDYKKDLKIRKDTSSDKFNCIIQGKKYSNRKDAAKAIHEIIKKRQGKKNVNHDEKIEIGELAGFKILLQTYATEAMVPVVYLKTNAQVYKYHIEDYKGNIPQGVFISFENRLRSIDKEIKKSEEVVKEYQKKIEGLQEEIKKPFKYESELKEMQNRQAEINKELNLDGEENVTGLEEEQTEYDSIVELEKPKRYTDITIRKTGNFKQLSEDDLSIAESLPDKYINSVRKLPKDIDIPNQNFIIELFSAASEMMTPARYKKLRSIRELGAYTPGKKIELRTVTNIVTMAHELGHAFDYNMNDGNMPKSINQRFEHDHKKPGVLESKLRQELKKVSNYVRPHPGGINNFDQYRNNHKELMADFYALYFLDPGKAKKMAPTVYELVESELNAKMFNGNDSLRNLVDKLREARNQPKGDRLKLEDMKLIEEPFEILPKEITNPTEAAKELVKNTDRIYRAMVHEASKRARRWKNQLSDEQLEDLGAAVEGIDNLRTGKSAEQIKENMTAKQKAILKEYRYYQERERERINKFLESTGEKEYISYIEDYLAHFYAGGPKKRKFVSRWMKNSPNAKKRVFPTFQEAVEAGFTPLTQNVAELHQKWATINWRVAVNRRFVYELKHIVNDDGLPVIMKPNKAPEDWPIIDHPAIRQVYAKKKKDGTVELWHGGAAIDPDVYKIVKQVLEQPFTGNVVKAVEMFNAYAKKAALSISLFHHWALTESAQAALASGKNPLRGIILIGSDKETAETGIRIPFTSIKISRPHRAGVNLMENSEFAKDAIMHGLVVDEAPDVHIGKVKKLMQTVEAKTAKIPGLGYLTRKIRQANDWWDTQLWTKYHNGLKAYTYYSLVNEALKKAPENISEQDIKATKEKIAELINDMYGGQEWVSKFWLTPKGRQAVHIAFLAPDWTMSAFNVATKTVTQAKNPIARKYLIRYWRNMFASLGGLIIALNLALAGRPPWENEPDHKTDIDVTKIMRALPWIDDDEKRRYYISPGKQVKEVFRYLENPVEILGAKASPIVHTVFEQWTGHQAGSGWPMPWEYEELSFYESLPARTLSIMEKFKPFALRGNNFAFTFPMSRGMSAWKAQRAFEDLFKSAVDPTFMDKFKRKITNREVKDLAKELIEACKLNGLEYEKMIKQANTKVRTEYYSKMWKAIENKEFEQADKYAKVLLKLGATPKTIIKSGERRGQQKEDIAKALKLVINK